MGIGGDRRERFFMDSLQTTTDRINSSWKFKSLAIPPSLGLAAGHLDTLRALADWVCRICHGRSLCLRVTLRHWIVALRHPRFWSFQHHPFAQVAQHGRVSSSTSHISLKKKTPPSRLVPKPHSNSQREPRPRPYGSKKHGLTMGVPGGLQATLGTTNRISTTCRGPLRKWQEVWCGGTGEKTTVSEINKSQHQQKIHP